MAIWSPDPDRIPGATWETAGLSSPIPDYIHLYNVVDYGADPTGVSNCDAAVAAAKTALFNDGLDDSAIYFPKVDASTPGIYKVSQLSVDINSGFGFLGDGQAADGTWLTVIKPTGDPGVQLGRDCNYSDDPALSPQAGFSASKGDLTLSITYVGGSASFVAGRKMCRILLPTDSELPVTSGNGLVQRRLTVHVTNVSGTTLTLSRPIPYDMTDGVIKQGQLGTAATIRVEGMYVDCSAQGPQNVVGIANSEDIQLRNCKFGGHSNYCINMLDPIGVSIESCWVAESTFGGTSHAGILSNGAFHSLFADNIVELNGPAWEINSCTTACVFRDNYVVEGGSGYGFDTNHGAQNTMNLYQNNLTCNFLNEGYHGGGDRDTYFGNYVTSLNPTIGGSQLGYVGMVLKRWSSLQTVANNLLMDSAEVWGFSYLLPLGQPNIGNSRAFGTCSFRGAIGELTTRTSNTAGTITADSATHGVTTGQVMDIAWAEGTNPVNGYVRRDVTVGTVSGTTIPFSGGLGANLPAQNTDIHFPTTNAASKSFPFDWDSTLGDGEPRRWTGVLTTRTTARSGVLTIDTGGLWASLQEHFQRAIWDLSSTTGGACSLFGGGASVLFIFRVSMSGDTLTFDNASSDLPAQGSSVTLLPCATGFQELDTQVLLDAEIVGNYNFIDDAIPAVEALPGGTTFPDSLCGDTKPSYYGALAWPPFTGTDPSTADPNRLPAYLRYTGNTPSTDPTTAISGLAKIAGTVTIQHA